MRCFIKYAKFDAKKLFEHTILDQTMTFFTYMGGGGGGIFHDTGFSYLSTKNVPCVNFGVRKALTNLLIYIL